MKKLHLFLALAVLAGAGYLAYDWHTVIQARKQPPKVTFYAWSDEKGVRHFTEAPPPAGARNVEKSTGVAQPREPLVVRMKDAVVDAYRGIRSKFTDDPGQPKKYKRVM
jgi:hypothetical protein